MAYANIDKCGLYQDDCRNWSRKPRSETAWVKFKNHFARSFKGTRRSSKKSRTEGYVARVHSAQANAELFTEMQQDHTQALVNLVTATHADRTSVAPLKKTISAIGCGRREVKRRGEISRPTLLEPSRGLEILENFQD